MFSTSELYELSFVPPSKEARTRPQIVFATRTEYFTGIKDNLYRVVEVYRQHASTYLSCDSDITFIHPDSDLFGQVEFGYGRCGFVTTEGGRTYFRIELASEDHIFYSTLTIHVLTLALGISIDLALPSNQLQQVELETRCLPSGPYGHAVGGYVSAHVFEWLRNQGRQRDECARTIQEIVEAMRQT